MSVLGRHLLINFYECEFSILDSVEGVQELMHRAAALGGATIVREVFHRFSPQGVSGVIVIAESHLAIHTWPEHRFAAVDLFTCGTSVDTELVMRTLEAGFGANRATQQMIARGELPLASPSSHPFAESRL